VVTAAVEQVLHSLHFGLVVGIWRYPGGFADLQGPGNDAIAFRDWLLDPDGGGLPPDNVRTCLSPGDGELSLFTAVPTKTLIDLQLDELRLQAKAAFERLPEEDRATAPASARLYIFVAGHGVMPDGGTAALLDAVARQGATTCLDLGEYAKWLEKDGIFGEVVVFADCCRNYQLLVEARGPDFNKPSGVGGRVFQIVGYATTGGALSREDTARYEPDIPADERRGYYSRALVEGLRGGAVDPVSGHVTSQRLHEYVRSRVRARTAHRPLHQQQDVDTIVNLSHQMIFGPRRSVPRYRVVIGFPPDLTEDVELVGPEGPSGYWSPADGPWTIRLYDGLWTVQRAGTDLDTTGFTGDPVFRVDGADCRVQL
jgi:hypothetical protein